MFVRFATRSGCLVNNAIACKHTREHYHVHVMPLAFGLHFLLP
jgi:hypothetical protein